MTILNLMISVLIFAFGICLGFYFGFSSRKGTKYKKDGTVVVNTLDPHKDVVKIELAIPIVEMMRRKDLYFDVRNEDS